MKPVTQILLFVSYIILGLAIIILPPRLFGADPMMSAVIGIFVFVVVVQATNLFASGGGDGSLKARIEKLEDTSLVLRNEMDRTRRSVEKRAKDGDERNSALVSELKVLQTLLGQVMKREKELISKGAKKKKAPAKADDSVPAAEEAEIVQDVAEEEEIQVLSEADLNDEGDAVEDKPAEEKPKPKPEPKPEKATEPKPAKVDDASEDKIVRTEAKEHSRAQAPEQTRRQREGRAPTKKAPIRIIKKEDQLLSVIHSSLSENRVDLYLQPIVALPSRRAKHWECFSRVRDEEGRIVLPRQYMKVAEGKGLIGTIDNLLLFRLIQLVRKLGRRKPDMKFFCNLSAHSMNDAEFFPQFVDFMSTNEEFTNRMVFEISQEDFGAIGDEVQDQLIKLGRRGFGFSLDQYSNFEEDMIDYRPYNFEFVKADVRDLISYANNSDLGELKAEMRLHGMSLIGSRVETEEQVVEALDLEIELAQGYLFAEPENANDLDREL